MRLMILLAALFLGAACTSETATVQAPAADPAAAPAPAEKPAEVAPSAQAQGGKVQEVVPVNAEAKAEGHEGCGAHEGVAEGGHGEMKEGEAAVAPSAEVKHLGAAFTQNEHVPLGKVLEAPEAFQDKTVKVSGKISSVCKKKGCWFVVQDAQKPDQSVRITMKDYGFFVPLDSAGKEAVIEGQFSLKVLAEKERKHLAEDEGKDASKVTGDVKEFSLVATAIDLK
jgi:hypothetical protein